jgi:hypothetical protein
VLYRIIGVLDEEKAERVERAQRAAQPHWAP